MTTADELFKHLDSGGGDHATKEPALPESDVDDAEDRIYPYVPGDSAERARAATPGRPDAQFLALLSGQPYCRINAVADRCDVSRQTASSWLHALVEAGLMSDLKVGRELLFVNDEFLDVLTRPE